MERKRELTSVDLAAITQELQAVVGAKVDKAYRYDDDLIRLRMRDLERGRLELFIEVGAQKRLHLADPDYVPDAPTRPPNFARMLRNRLSGADLVTVEQHGFDRVVTLTFERGDGRTRLVAELFGDGNLIVCDGSGDIVDAIRTVRLRSRTVAPGAPYIYPDPQHDPFDMEYAVFREAIEGSDADLVRTLATRCRLGGQYAEEVCARADVDKSQPVEQTDDATLERIYAILEEIASIITDGRFDPHIYFEDDTPIDVAPLPLDVYRNVNSESFETFNAAVDEYFRFVESESEEAAAPPDRTAEIERTKRIIDQQSAAIEEFTEDAMAMRDRAEALYANYELADEILSTIRDARAAGHDWPSIEATFAEAAANGHERAGAVRGIDESSQLVRVDLSDHEVALDVSMGVERNANRLYTEAKEIEEKRAGAEAALEDTRKNLAELEQAPAVPEEAAEDDVTDESVDWTARSSIPIRPSDEWFERFRWFHTSDGFLVIGGRNADQNEELVKKYLEPHDRFFHAQAHGGPVTILKATGPSERSRAVEFPQDTLEEAAQFAISYSSVWKAGQFAGDAYAVGQDQVSKTAESGEYLSKGEFVVRGERTYYENVPVGVAIGITCEPLTRVIGGPPRPVRDRAEVSLEVEPGNVAQSDVAKRMYRMFRESFEDTTFVRKVASPDQLQSFLPPGQSVIKRD